jgi:hypothetical protein
MLIAIHLFHTEGMEVEEQEEYTVEIQILLIGIILQHQLTKVSLFKINMEDEKNTGEVVEELLLIL